MQMILSLSENLKSLLNQIRHALVCKTTSYLEINLSVIQDKVMNVFIAIHHGHCCLYNYVL